MEIWLEDKETGLQCGKNNDGDLFWGDNYSGANAPDTPENRKMIVRDFCRYTGREMPAISAAGTPIKFDGTMVAFNR